MYQIINVRPISCTKTKKVGSMVISNVGSIVLYKDAFSA